MRSQLNTKTRTLNYIAAFDHALLELVGASLANVDKNSLEYTKIAIKASHCHCGPIARYAENWFKTNGIPGAKFHSIEGHYVLLDEETGLLFDLESVGGKVNRVDMPIFERMMEIQIINRQHEECTKIRIDEIFNKSADKLLRQRRIALSVN